MICYLKWRGPLRVTQSAGYLDPNLPQTWVPAICFILFFSPANTLLGHSQGEESVKGTSSLAHREFRLRKTTPGQRPAWGEGHFLPGFSFFPSNLWIWISFPSLEVLLSSKWSQEPQTMAPYLVTQGPLPPRSTNPSSPRWNCSPPTRKLMINLAFSLSQHLGEFDTQVLLLLLQSKARLFISIFFFALLVSATY